MRLVVLLTGIFLMCGAASASADDKPAKADTWKTYTYAEEGFSASFPSEPKKTTAKGTVVIAASVPVEGGAIQYSVRVGEGVDKELAKLTFDTISKQFGDKVKSQKDIELKGGAGREMVIEMEVKDKVVVITQRLFIVNKHLYQVMVAVPKSKQEEAQSKKFLDSFKLSMDAPK